MLLFVFFVHVLPVGLLKAFVSHECNWLFYGGLRIMQQSMAETRLMLV